MSKLTNQRMGESANGRISESANEQISEAAVGEEQGPNVAPAPASGPRSRAVRSKILSKLDAGWLIAGLLTLFIIQTLLQPGLPTTAADIPIHLYRTMEYERAWAPGVMVPRWSPNLAYGYGYPLFVFAPPLPYLLGVGLHQAGFTFGTALKLLIIFTIPLYAIGMYFFVRDTLKSVAAGLIASTAFAFAPFALRESLLYGGNVPQFLAIGLFPWTLWAMTRAARLGSWRWAMVASLFYTGVLLSHLFQVLIFTPVVALYGLTLALGSCRIYDRSGSLSLSNCSTVRLLYHVLRGGRIKATAPLLSLLPIPIGMVLGAFFWIPAFIERFSTRAQADLYLEKSPFFVRYPHWTELLAWIPPLDAQAANPYVPLTLGWITVGLAGLGLVAGVRFALKSDSPAASQPDPADVLPVYRLPTIDYLIFFFTLVAAGAIFMTLPASRQVWETVSILQVAEFPWRMLGLANLGLAFLAGAGVLLLRPKIRFPADLICIALQLFAVGPFLYPVTGFTRYNDVTIADQIAYERSSQSIGTTTLGEYLPRTVTEPPTTSPLVDAYQTGKIPERLDRGSLPSAGTAELLEQTAVTHRYRLNSPIEFTLRFFQFHYPGWQARLDGRSIPLRPEADTGLILLDMPAGQHILTLHFGETPGRVMAMAVTGFTLACLLIITLFYLRRTVASRRAAGLPLTQRPFDPLKLPLLSTPVVAGLIVITVAALWLKPVLRPLFTVKSPSQQILPAQHQTNIAFANGIRLTGYEVSQEVISPGDYLQVVLYWQTSSAPLEVNLQPFVHLDRLNDLTTVADATNYTPGDVTTESNLPTFHWDNQRYIRDEHDLYLPPDLPPLAYAVRVGLIDPAQGNRLIPLASGQGDTARLTTINVSPHDEPAPLAQPLDATFTLQEDTIHLTGFEIDSLTPERLDFTLAWQTEQPLQNDYTVFAQLLASNQKLVASFDTPPLDDAYPTSTWLAGQTILDSRYIPLNQVSPGQYQLIAGLYHSVTHQRLTTPTGANFVTLTQVTINR